MLKTIWVSVRTLFRSKLYALSALATIALGLGANAVIFSAVYAVLIDPLPFRDADRLTMIWETNHELGRPRNLAAPTNFFDWQDQTRVFDGMAATAMTRLNLNGGDGPGQYAEQLNVATVSAAFFPLLGVAPKIGRSFSPEEDRPGGARVAILSNGLWRRRFGGDEQAIGKPVILNGTSYTIIGVMPEDFRFLADSPALWVPIGLNRARWAEGRYIQVLARLAPNITLQRAQQELSDVARRLEDLDPEKNKGWGVTLVPLYDQYVGGIRQMLTALMAATILVLLIACANVASLTLARGVARIGDTGIRTALGASRRRIIGEMLLENVILSLLGGAIGLFIAYFGVKAIPAMLPSDVSIPRLTEMRVGLPVLLFTNIAALVTAVLFGIVPALSVMRMDLAQILNERSSRIISGRRFLNALIMAEVAVSVVLLAAAGLMARSLYNLQTIKLGFQSNDVMTFQFSLPESEYPQPENIRQFVHEADQRIRSITGVEAVGAIDGLPLSGDGVGTFFSIPSHGGFAAGQKPIAYMRAITPGYFDAIKTPVIRGRVFTADDDDKRPSVYIINETLAKRYFPGEDPIGQKIELTWDKPLIGEIVGVVENTLFSSLTAEPGPTIYWPHDQMTFGTMNMVVRTAVSPESMMPAITRQMQELNKSIPLTNVRTMAAIRSDAMSRTRLSVNLLTAMSSAATGLVAMGIFGMLSYLVARRTHEIGVRMALGATPSSVISMVVWQGLKPCLYGLLIGVIGALFCVRFLSTLIYGVSALDPATFFGVGLLLIILAAVAALGPALLASRTPPYIALRKD